MLFLVADYSGIQSTLFEFALGRYAVATAVTASMGLLAIRRVWRVIRSSI